MFSTNNVQMNLNVFDVLLIYRLPLWSNASIRLDICMRWRLWKSWTSITSSIWYDESDNPLDLHVLLWVDHCGVSSWLLQYVSPSPHNRESVQCISETNQWFSFQHLNIIYLLIQGDDIILYNTLPSLLIKQSFRDAFDNSCIVTALAYW